MLIGSNGNMDVGIDQLGFSECSKAQSMRCIDASHLFVGCFKVKPCMCIHLSIIKGTFAGCARYGASKILASYGTDSPATYLATTCASVPLAIFGSRWKS